MRNCSFERADLHNAKFRDCDLRGASFRQANLFHADFSRSDLTGAVTHLAQIGYTVLEGAKLDSDEIVIPDELSEAVESIQDAGFAIVPGSQDAHDPVSEWELDTDGETISTNYSGVMESDHI
jgi:hypothetical protein